MLDFLAKLKKNYEDSCHLSSSLLRACPGSEIGQLVLVLLLKNLLDTRHLQVVIRTWRHGTITAHGNISTCEASRDGRWSYPAVGASRASDDQTWRADL